MKKWIAALIAAASFMTVGSGVANASTSWCPQGVYPGGATCQTVYHWISPGPPTGGWPDDGSSSNYSTPNEHTYLHVGDAMWWLSERYWYGTSASFHNWVRCQLAACAAGPSIYYAGTTAYTRNSDTSVTVRITGYRPDQRTYCWWVATIIGVDASMSGDGNGITEAACDWY